MVYDSAETEIWKGSHIDVFVSRDGGRTWRQRPLPMVGAADPWVSVDHSGTTYLSYLGQHAPDERIQLYYRTSEDGGDRWSDPVSLGPFHDRETMVSAHIGGRNVTFLTSSVNTWRNRDEGLAHAYLARAEDGGPFDSLTAVLPNNLQSNTFNAVVTPNGTLVMTLQDYATTSFQMLQTRRAWLLVSSDLGETLSEPRFVAEDLAPRTYFVLAADPSSRWASNRLYTVRTVLAGENGRALALSASDDFGHRWSAPVIVAGPDHGARPVGPAHVVVDGSGTVAVAWFDRRHGLDESTVDLYVTASTDGGTTFSSPTRVTEVTSNNAVEGNGRVKDRFRQGGDYFGLVPRGEGRFLLMWADSRTGVYQLHTSVVRVR